LFVVVIVGSMVAAVLGLWLAVYEGPASLVVSTTTPFVAAGDHVPFSAIITTPAAVHPDSVAWQFGDGSRIESDASSVDYPYPFSGTFFVAASAQLSNGGSVDNFEDLFPMQVGPQKSAPRPFGSTASLGVIAINGSASTEDAPLIAVGGVVQVEGTVAQAPTFFYPTQLSNAGNDGWENFTWAAVAMTIDFGDGSPPTNTTDMTDPFVARHAYETPGIFAITLQVTTQNLSARQSDGLPVDPTPTPVIPEQFERTTVGQSVAVGTFRLVTYAGSVVNPGVIIDMKAASGGYFSLDPAISYLGDYAIPNVYETLLAYDGSATDSFVPVVADSIPTVANGAISPDYLSYTFQVRPGLDFSDGRTVTAWDVKYSFTRTLLFTYGSPSTPGWLLAQYLLPIDLDGHWNLSFRAVDAAIRVDNASQTVTLRLARPSLPLVMYQLVSSFFGPWIVDPGWLESVGPKLIWSEGGFRDYQKYGLLSNYVSTWRNGAVGSGPYMIDYVANPDAIALKANPLFVPVYGLPKPAVPHVLIEFISTDDVRELSLEAGQADIVGIAPTRFERALAMQSAGLIRILFAPTLNLNWWAFNMEIAGSTVGPNSNPYGNHVPPDFFVDLNMRKAFFYAFDFDRFLDQILGNVRFNATFGVKFNGAIPLGMIGYQDLSSSDIFDLRRARDVYNQTQWVKDRGWANSGFTLTINVPVEDPLSKTGAAAWALNLESLAPGITINVMPLSDAELAATANPHENPAAIEGILGWSPDYPFPTDYTVAILLPGTAAGPSIGLFPSGTGLNIDYFANDRNGTDQVADLTRMFNWIEDSLGPNSTDLNRVISDSRLAQDTGANLTLFVPAMQPYTFFTYRTWIGGMDRETNPEFSGIWFIYAFLSKEGPVSSLSDHESDASMTLGSTWLAVVAPEVLLPRASRSR